MERSTLLIRSEIREWFVAISVSKFDLQGQRFTICIFVGDVPSNPDEWSTSPSCVGCFPILPPSRSGNGPLPDVTVYDEVSLMNGLQAAGYDGQDVGKTVEYLKGALQWGVQLVSIHALELEVIERLIVG
jgi:tyrosinase